MGSIWNSTGQLEVNQVAPGSAALDSGRSWVASIKKQTIATATNLDILLNTGADIGLKGEFSVSAFGEVEVELREDPTVTVAGTSVPFINRNRVDPTSPPDSTVETDPTMSDPGTLLASIYLPGGDKNNAVGLTGDIQGWVLKKSSFYLLRVTNTSAGDVDVAFVASIAEIPE